MSYFDPEVYNVDNLKGEDKKYVTEIEFFKERVLNKSVIEEFVSEYCKNKKMTEIFEETLVSFTDYLREKFDCCMWDTIIEIIDNYTDCEFELLCKKTKGEITT